MLAHKTTDKISSYMAFIPGEVLYNIYRLFGQRLLNLNVRSFLQLGTKINKGIRETLINEPGRFFSYNNGIVVGEGEYEVTTANQRRKHGFIYNTISKEFNDINDLTECSSTYEIIEARDINNNND